MLNAAIEDGLITANPAANLGRALKLTVSKSTRQEESKAMTKVQRQHFLATILQQAPRYYPLFFVLAGTGERLGEALAIQDGDLDLNAQTIRIARAFSEDGTLDTPKSGHGRTVDLSQALTAVLAIHLKTMKQDRLKHSWTDQTPWLFVTKNGTPLDPANVRRAMTSVLKKAKLPLHFTPHCLRHTYASILLSEGVLAPYVQEQLGHATNPDLQEDADSWYKSHFKKAVQAAGLVGKRITFHSTRHTWAGRFLEGGGTIRSLQKAGDWSDIRLVEIYTHPFDDQLRAAMERGARIGAATAGKSTREWQKMAESQKTPTRKNRLTP